MRRLSLLSPIRGALRVSRLPSREPAPTPDTPSPLEAAASALPPAVRAEGSDGPDDDLDLDGPDLPDGSGAASSKRSVLSVIRDLESRNAVHAATMQAMERTREWRDYDAHAHFELSLLRLRYAGAGDKGEAMPAQRRAQMQAHLRAKQLEVMEEHAAQAAAGFLRALTPDEALELRAKLRRVDASTDASRAGGEAAAGGGIGGSAFDAELRDALAELSALLPALSKRG